jgi:hypothetical protein
MSSVTMTSMARVAYEAHRAYAHALGEDEQPKWEQASPRQRMEAMAGVQAVLSGEARSGAHLHEAWSKRATRVPFGVLTPGYDQLGVADRRKVLLFRAVVLALIDGPCNGFCHDDKCPNLDDHDCHLDTCMSRFGVPPGLWQETPAATASGGQSATSYS